MIRDQSSVVARESAADSRPARFTALVSLSSLNAQRGAGSASNTSWLKLGRSGRRRFAGVGPDPKLVVRVRSRPVCGSLFINAVARPMAECPGLSASASAKPASARTPVHLEVGGAGRANRPRGAACGFRVYPCGSPRTVRPTPMRDRQLGDARRGPSAWEPEARTGSGVSGFSPHNPGSSGGAGARPAGSSRDGIASRTRCPSRWPTQTGRHTPSPPR